MKRVVAAVALLAAVALGTSACSSDSEPAEEPVVEETSSVVEEEDTTEETPAADLSTADACLSLAEPIQEVNLAFASMAEDAQSDPQTAVDMWRTLSETFEEFGATVANPEVAELATAVGEDGHALTDIMQQVYVDQDFSSMDEFSSANEAFWASYEELLGLCDTTP